jgi:hypothetical protein
LRAHLGGRLVDGKTQAMFAWRQLEHGDCLSQRTLRLRHTTQLRNFSAGAGADDRVLADADEVAFFSELKAEAPPSALPGGVATDTVAAGTCDMLQWGNWRYYSSRLVVTLPSLSTPAWCCEEADTDLFFAAAPASPVLCRLREAS